MQFNQSAYYNGITKVHESPLFWASKASKIVREWNGHLEVFSRPQVIENSRQYFLYSLNSYFEENGRWVALADFHQIRDSIQA